MLTETTTAQLKNLEAPTKIFKALINILNFESEEDLETKLNTFNDWKLVREFLDTKTKEFHAIGLSPSHMCELGKKIIKFYKDQRKIMLTETTTAQLNNLGAPTEILKGLINILNFESEEDLETKLNTFNDWKLVREFLDTKTKEFHAIGLSPSHMCELGNKITEFYKAQQKIMLTETTTAQHYTLSPEYNS